MEFALNKRQEEVLRTARRFSERLVLPKADGWDKSKKFPTDTWRAMARAGLTGLPIPRKYGGGGQDILSYVLAVEEISRGSAALGVTLAVHVSLVSQPLLSYGTEQQKMHYLKPLAQGAKFGSFCLTEPGAGSDVASMESKATRSGDDYVIHGRKYFIVNAPMASTYLVFAMTDKSLAHRGISCFIVDRKMPGVKIGKIFDKMGIRSSMVSEVIFDDVRVPAKNMLGRPGGGIQDRNGHARLRANQHCRTSRWHSPGLPGRGD